MRSITIDFTKSPVEISSTILGRKGENNATQLVITPPAEMSSEDSGVVCYSVAFQIGANRKKHSAVYAKAETITVPLERAVTQVNVLSLQLEGYDGEENLIMKSERIDNLLFDASIDGDEYNGAGESNLGAQVAAHEAKLSRPTATVEAIGELATAARIDMASFEVLAIGAWADEYLYDKVPLGAEIKTIEFRLEGQDEWIDIHRMHEYDGIPCVINMVYVSDGTYHGVYDKLFALITPAVYSVTNFLHDAMLGNQNGDIRITYYNDYLGGENYA